MRMLSETVETLSLVCDLRLVTKFPRVDAKKGYVHTRRFLVN